MGDKKKSLPMTIFDRDADVEVIFAFNGTRTRPIYEGYRPCHRITDTYLTTGLHHYYNVDVLPPTATVKGTITFIAPEAYPHSLRIGKKIPIQEGEKVIGCATVTKVLNPLLQAEEEDVLPAETEGESMRLMRTPPRFYLIGEFTDDVKYCRRHGLKPHETVTGTLDGAPFQQVIRYSKDGYIYDVSECEYSAYTGAMIVLMRLPEPSYGELLEAALSAGRRDERIGAIGVLMKKYPARFGESLLALRETQADRKRKRQIRRMAAWIDDLGKCDSTPGYVKDMEPIMTLCGDLRRKR